MTTKLDLVKNVLASSENIRDWYETEHKITADMLDVQNVKTYGYGTGNYGDAADLIISDGIEAGIITEEDAENWEY